MYLVHQHKYRDEYLLTIPDIIQSSDRVKEEILLWMPNRTGDFFVEVDYHRKGTRRENASYHVYKLGQPYLSNLIIKQTPLSVILEHVVNLNELRVALLLTE